MKSDLAAFDLVTATSVPQACERIRAGYRPLAGGTDVMVLLAAGKLRHTRWVDIAGVEDLRRIEVRDDAVVLGALTTYTDVRRHPVVSTEFPMLAQAAKETGGIAIQNRGTLGGNIANASPAADSPPALLAYGAELVLQSGLERRTVPYASFHTGYKKTIANDGEIVAGIVLPRATGRAQLYRKVGPRRAQAISKVCFAGCAERNQGRLVDVRIAYGGVAPTVVRAHDAERAILAGANEGDVCAALANAIAPIDDIRSNAKYRKRVAENLLKDFLRHVGLDR